MEKKIKLPGKAFSLFTFTIKQGSNISKYFQGVYNSVPGHEDT